jgi:glycosyltransferase involved in cell wall biosynthesis
MHILFVSYWYHPEPVSKPHNFAVELVRRGHSVMSITGFPNYPSGHLYKGYTMRRSQWEQIDGVSVLRVPFIVDRSKSGLRRILSFTSFALSVTAAVKSLKSTPSVIWTYQLGLPGVVLSKLMHTSWVHEVQDLWPEWGKSGGMGVDGVLYNLLDAQERFIYRNAHAITTISEGFKNALVEKGVPPDKITVIPNWANEPQLQPCSIDPAALDAEGLAGRFNVLYGGNIGTAQGLGVVLDAAERLRDLPRVQFVIIGDGVERESLERQASDRHINNVRFLGSRPPSSMAGYYAEADVLLIHLKQSREYTITIPSKTYSYLAAGKPIIAAASGEVAALVTRIGTGVACTPENPDSLAGAVRILYDCSASQRDEMGKRGYESFHKSFSRQVLVGEYEALFHHIITDHLRVQ